MLNRIIAKFRPSPAMVVAVLGVAIGLGSTGWAANGAAFVLGVVNSATARTFLGATYNGTALQVSNTSTGAAATALALSVPAGRPPMTVNSTSRVANLNSDYLDGLDSTAVARVERIPFTLAAGANTAPIVLPVNTPVHVMGTGIHGSDRLGQVTIVRDSGGGTLWWIGAESSFSEPSRTGVSNVPGTHIVSLDFYTINGGGAGQPIQVEVNGPTGIRVHNGDQSTRSGVITLMW